MAGLMVVGVAAIPMAGAQTTTTNPYPGGCSVLVSESTAGSVAVGGTITVPLPPTCVWTPNSAVEVTVNGVNVGTKIANASGFVTVSITALSATTLSVDDPVLTPAVCGTNTVIGRGTSTVANGRIVTHQATFTLVCPAAPVATPTPARVALTGANLSKWLAIALVTMVGGGVFVVAGRRRREPGATA